MEPDYGEEECGHDDQAEHVQDDGERPDQLSDEDPHPPEVRTINQEEDMEHRDVPWMRSQGQHTNVD